MIKDNKPLRVFVAMPGTRESIGADAVPWSVPKDIEKFFYRKIEAKLKKELQRPITFNIEKEKRLSGTIYDSMYGEAWQSDVYIADLTGNNPNVYLELGVRWALKDKVTILVSQQVSTVKFNAAYARVFPYDKDPGILEQAIETVVKSIKEGLAKKDHIDSPVRLKGDIAAASKEELKAYEEKIRQLEEEIKELKLAQGRNFQDVAESTKDPEQRIAMYQKALAINPALIDAYLPLAEEQRLLSRYEEAITTLRQALSFFPTHAEFHRELGVIYKKLGQFEQAEKSLREAVKLNDKDDEAWSNLGGLLRQMAVGEKPYNWDILRESRNSYNKALAVNDRNTYALGNVARLDLLLSKQDPERKAIALDELDTLNSLCRFELKKNPQDYWRRFDIADTHLLTGETDEGQRLYDTAIELVPPKHRASVISSVIPPLAEFLLLAF